MDIAFQTDKKRTYYALDFSKLPAGEIRSLRYNFICDDCRQPAFFRKAASSGQGPCFGAKHTDKCGVPARATGDPWDKPGDDLVQKLEADKTKIVLNLGKGTGAGADDDGFPKDGSGKGGRSHSSLGAGASRSKIQRNPEKLLRALVDAPSFRTSSLLIDGPNGEMPVHQFFVEMKNASRKLHRGGFHGFWGKVTRTNVWNGLRLFNGAPAPSLGFEISDPLVTQIVKRYNLSDISDVVGRYAIFLGYPRLTQNASFMMDVPDIGHFAMLPKRDET
ncbi:hypothetical protein [Luteimonas fraxinea]|uniref:hypothetical protein n=1 Tax=Luteimonas fraxinea TaxID=2901869 RepID=UPI001E50044E|nr:hypothetical protein [Luteimonas fraxinea]MCD9126688.1 hypothetical protein [Luteimonas fraxinea]